MKRTISSILALALLLVLMVGCGTAETSKPAADTASTAQQAPKAEAASATGYPKKPITLIIPYSAGGTADTFGRIIAEYLGKELGTTVTVVNQAGSSGEIGTLAVTQSEPDGYTLGILNFPDFFISDLTNEEFEFDTLSSVQYITSFTNTSNAYWVQKNNSKANTWDEFVEYCKANPGKFTVAESGIAHRFIAAAVMDHFGIEYTTINYDGSAESQAAIVGGQVDGCSMTNQKLDTFTSQGVVPIVWGGLEPCPADPDIPLFADYNLNIDFLNVRVTLVAPAGVPQEIVDTLAAATEKICANPDFGAMFTAQNYKLDPVLYGAVGELAAADYNEAQELCTKYKDQIIGIK